jgi:hypothetical protein
VVVLSSSNAPPAWASASICALPGEIPKPIGFISMR